MPQFTQVSQAQLRKRKGAVPPEVAKSYEQYIAQLGKGNVGYLRFDKGDESIDLGRKALVQAGLNLKKPVKVRRVRGESTLIFSRVPRVTKPAPVREERAPTPKTPKRRK